jgi:Spy/CpxP family protein refolding chaperone
MTDRPRALAVLIAVFMLGGVVGAGGMYLGLNHFRNSDKKFSQNMPPGPQQGRQRMREQLQLTSEQEEQFGKIMAESRKQMDAVRSQDQPKIEKIFSEQQPKIEAIFGETNKKLMAVLNPEQQKKFEALWQEMSSRRRHSPYGRENGHGADGGRGMGMPPPPPQ